MHLLYALAAACVAAALMTAIFRTQKMEKCRFVSKLIASLLFCAAGLYAAGQREQMNIYVALLLGALILGLVGDILLGLDRFVPEEARRFLFKMGGVPFFFGHVLYIVLLLPVGNFDPGVLLILPVVPVVFLVLQRVKLVDFGRDLVPLMLYGAFLSAMMMTTVNVARQGAALPQGESLARLMILPGILFAVSDITLFVGRYGNEKTRKGAPVFAHVIMLTYYSAQAMFALAVRYI